ncbi:MAG TPA: response regulator [Candidatus Saccharimonadales bacterium]|nr:response regulator [Candidatus Saccharimonadales bacterium]
MPKILIVEDEKPLAEAYRIILERHKYDVSVAYDGEEALTLIEQYEPDLILLDMKLPKMSGLDFLRNLDAHTTPSKVIVFSNQDSQSDIDEAFKLGAKRYLLKSWAAPHDLVRIIEEALES